MGFGTHQSYWTLWTVIGPGRLPWGTCCNLGYHGIEVRSMDSAVGEAWMGATALGPEPAVSTQQVASSSKH